MYYSPVRHSFGQASLAALVRLACIRHAASVYPWPPSFDLHVLGTPPAFILSQDQTLHLTLALLSLSLRFSLNSLTLCVSSVQFSKISCSLSLNALCYNTTIRSCVNSFLQNFFSSLSLSLPLRRALYYLFIFPV